MRGLVLNSLNRLSREETAQGMVEYLLILSLVVFTITAIFAALMHLFS
jgi:Flp pilus assembly pilin Flp